MDSTKNDRATTPTIAQDPRIISALVVNRSPSGTLRTTNDRVLLQQISGFIQPSGQTDIPGVADVFTKHSEVNILNEEHNLPSTSTTSRDQHQNYLLPLTLSEALAVDSGSENDEEEADYTEIELQQILEEGFIDDEEVQEFDPVAEAISDLTWSDNFETFTATEEIHTEQCGPTISSTDPFELFSMIWDRGVMERIVHETNEYAWQLIVRATESDSGIASKSRLHDWYPVTVEEMYKFFSILIYMGLCYRGRVEEYWTTGVLGIPEFRKIMSINRFLLILRFLHFVDNYSIDSDIRGTDRKIIKIAPIVEHCCQKFQEMYKPRRHITIDESLLLWKGRLSWVQCIRSKAARFGIKSYELCEAETGYLLKMLIYTGKGTSSLEPIHGFSSATAKTVLSLIEGYLHKGHCLVMDNFYNSVSIAQFLKRNGTDLMGTLNRRRVDTPAEIKTLKEKSMQRGDIVARHCGNVTVLAWKDVKLVTMISTHHNVATTSGRRAGVDCDKPLLVHSYNKYMGGVDMKDQKLSMYLLERKRGLKWYIKVFRRLINCSVLNTYIIHRANLQQPEQKPLNHRQFRYALAESLSKQHAFIQRIRPSAVISDEQRRLDGIDHFPDHLLNSDRVSNQRTRFKRGRCARCRAIKMRTESNVTCTKCQVFLCIGICWRIYHTKEDISVNYLG